MFTGAILLYFGFGRTVLLVCPFVNAYKLSRWLWRIIMIKRGTKIKDLQTGETRIVIAHFNNLIGTVLPSKFEDHAWESEKDIKIFFDYREFYTWEAVHEEVI